MLQPKKQKHRKQHRLRGGIHGKSARGTRLAFGQYGLKALGQAEVSARQIEAARRAMTRYLKRSGKVWTCIFPDKSISRKAAEVPMGSGKGMPEYFAMDVHPGRIIFEIGGVDEITAKKAMSLAAYKLPLKTKFITQAIC